MSGDPSEGEIELLRKRLERERRARREAEALAESGTRELYERQQQLELLHVIAETANGAASVEAALQVTIDEVCEYVDWPVGHAFVTNNDSPPKLVSSGLWHLRGAARFAEFRRVTEMTTLVSGQGLGGRVLASGKAAWIVDVNLDENFPRQQAVRGEVRGAFAFPVMVGSNVVAVLEFFSRDTVERNDTWLQLAARIGIQLGRTFERKLATQEMEKLHHNLMMASRQAGMADVATGVLHNVGNVLTSVNVIVGDVLERLRNSRLTHLRSAVRLLQREQTELAAYLTQDPQGRQLPAFLAKLETHLTEENQRLCADAEALVKHVEHIRGIVVSQQNSTQLFGVIENLPPAQLFEDALKLTSSSFGRHAIAVERDFGNTPPVRADRHKVLQILVNLLKNAKDSVSASRPSGRRITVHVGLGSDGRVALDVVDNGAGITPENLARIFSHGFTTKPTGHGFGLHSAILAAREMGGDLKANSEGPGHGARFTLELPVAAKEG